MRKRIIVIILIVAVAIGLAFGIDGIMKLSEKKTHPREFEDIVSRYSKEYGIPEYILYAVIKTESDFDPSAESSAGARGLMQMMPETFLWLTGSDHLNENLPAEALYDPEVSIKYGAYYLRYLYRKFDYNWDTVFAAYNAGEGNVRAWLSDDEYSDGKGGLRKIPFSETKNYLKKVNTNIDHYKKLYYEK